MQIKAHDDSLNEKCTVGRERHLAGNYENVNQCLEIRRVTKTGKQTLLAIYVYLTQED